MQAMQRYSGQENNQAMSRYGGKQGRGWDRVRDCYLLKSKHRVMGLDTEALDLQVDAHKAAREAAKAESVATALRWKEINAMLTDEEIRAQREKMQLSQQLTNDWHFQKKATDRIEADLNPRINMNYPINPDNTGVSAAQKFGGEDVSLKERNRLQGNQVREWCDQELRAKQELLEQERLAELRQVELDKEINAMRLQGEIDAKVLVQEQLFAVAEHNMLLAKEKKAELRMKMLLEKKANQWEVDNNYQSEVLSEYNYGRHRRDHYKGMSQEEIDEIHRFNGNKQKEPDYEKEEDMYWARNNQAVNTILADAEREEEIQKQAARFELNSDHLYQRREHKQREKFLKRDLGEGGVNDGFYSQFGSDCYNIYRSHGTMTKPAWQQ